MKYKQTVFKVEVSPMAALDDPEAQMLDVVRQLEKVISDLKAAHGLPSSSAVYRWYLNGCYRTITRTER